MCWKPRMLAMIVEHALLPVVAGQEEAFESAFGVTIGGGLGRLEGRCLRIGHMGDLDDLMVISTLAALEMTLPLCGVPVTPGGVQQAMTSLCVQAC